MVNSKPNVACFLEMNQIYYEENNKVAHMHAVHNHFLKITKMMFIH
jgi:hypothetical protein